MKEQECRGPITMDTSKNYHSDSVHQKSSARKFIHPNIWASDGLTNLFQSYICLQNDEIRIPIRLGIVAIQRVGRTNYYLQTNQLVFSSYRFKTKTLGMNWTICWKN